MCLAPVVSLLVSTGGLSRTDRTSAQTPTWHDDSLVGTIDRIPGVHSQVQRAAAGALRTLAFKNEENKNLIVECSALPTLIQMLRSDDAGIHYEAVGVIGNLVHSSQHIKKKVLDVRLLLRLGRAHAVICYKISGFWENHFYKYRTSLLLFTAPPVSMPVLCRFRCIHYFVR